MSSIKINVTEQDKKLLTDIAKLQGFRSASSMALFALNQYIERYNLEDKLAKKSAKSLLAVQHSPKERS